MENLTIKSGEKTLSITDNVITLLFKERGYEIPIDALERAIENYLAEYASLNASIISF